MAPSSPAGTRKVRVHDVGSKAVRRASDVERQPRVPAAAAAAGDDGPRQLVAPSLELALECRDERAEVRRVRPGVHLRDEQDPHATEPMRSRHPARQRSLNARRRCPRGLAGCRRSRRSCSARGGLRAVGGAGCRCRARSRGPVRARPPRRRDCARRGRGRCARRWRCSPSGSTRGARRARPLLGEPVDADDDARAGLDARSGSGRPPPRSRPGRTRPRSPATAPPISSTRSISSRALLARARR